MCAIAEEIERIEEQQAARDKPAAQSMSSTVFSRANIEALGSEVTRVLDGLGLSKPPKRLTLKLSELSGGWRMRAALAQCLCSLPQLDVLLLDEPTNHCESMALSLQLFPCDLMFSVLLLPVDLPTIAWLQGFLADAEVIVAFVSHDRCELLVCIYFIAV